MQVTWIVSWAKTEMLAKRRWDPCVFHQDDEIDQFLQGYLARPDRQILLVAGIGFDPRSCAVARRLARAGAAMRALLLTEVRPSPSNDLLNRADQNRTELHSLIPEALEERVEIFGSQNAVVGGRTVIATLQQQPLENVTDVVVDISALSIGTSFPIVRFLVERIAAGCNPQNLHVLFAYEPRVDVAIRSIPEDAPGYVHSFNCGSSLSTEGSAKLWMPQLANSRRSTLRRVYEFVAPDDTCPVLPFPASDPRRGDALAEEYLTEIVNTWSVDERNIVYADESDPLDLYRTVLRLDDRRQPMFAATGGSTLVLSPFGGKAMALGALLAAIERDLPVAYIESVEHALGTEVPRSIGEPDLVHLWLEGDAYPQPRPALRRADSRAE